jgi:ABC-type transport system involved in cytochrome bd biosynthesis fused ATPase/permease subunit
MRSFVLFLISVARLSFNSRLSYFFLLTVFFTSCTDISIILVLPKLLNSLLSGSINTSSDLNLLFFSVTLNFFLKLSSLYLLKRLSVKLACMNYSLLLENYTNLSSFNVQEFPPSEIRNSLYSLPLESVRHTIVPFLSLVSTSMISFFIVIGIFIIAPLESILIFGGTFAIYYIYFFLNKNRISSLPTKLSNIFESLERQSNVYADTFKSKVIYNYFIIDNARVAKSAALLFNYLLDSVLLARFPRILIESVSILLLLIISFNSHSGDSRLNIPLFSNIATIVYCAQRLLPLAQQFFNTFVTLKSYSKFHAEYYSILQKSQKAKSPPMSKLDVYTYSQYTQIKCTNIVDSCIPFSLRSPISFIADSHGLYIVSGLSGAGKSSLLDIICGFKIPRSGQVSVSDTLNSNIVSPFAYCEQSVFLIPGTIRTNIYIGDIPNDVTDSKIHQFLANNHESVLNAGSNLDLDRSINLERIDLSGGQQRRVCLARALLSSRSIVVLDEPTVGFDPDLELFYFSLIQEISRSKIVFLVTHSKQRSYLSPDLIVDLD